MQNENAYSRRLSNIYSVHAERTFTLIHCACDITAKMVQVTFGSRLKSKLFLAEGNMQCGRDQITLNQFKPVLCAQYGQAIELIWRGQ